MQSISCCCNNIHCSQRQEFNEIYKRISLDATLAAEIGQLLLEEKDNNTNNITYDVFEDTFKELKQLRLEKENSDKMILTLQEEMSKLKSHSDKLQVKLEKYEKDIKLGEQLLLLKTNNEQDLQDQVADLKQELTVSHKSQDQLSNKHKRLIANHETLQLSHEILKKEYDSLLKSKSEMSTRTVIPEQIPNQVESNTSSNKKKIIINNNNSSVEKHPYNALYTITKATFNKINATDTRILNRKLKRVFDMTELSDMSNAILRDILVELEDQHFQKKFEWVYDMNTDDSSIEFFFPLVKYIQRLLIDVTNMRLTMNDLQADYVKRIETTATMILPSSYTRRSSIVKEEPVKLEYYIDTKKRSSKRGLFDLLF